MPDDVRQLLDEQIEYYRVRAPEYDEWCERRGDYDYGPEANELWARDVATVEDALDRFAPAGDVLELASGTGWWTQRLGRYASSLTAVDASDETIVIARSKAPDAHYVKADIFTWEPDRSYDVVFFSFWLSHVPARLFDSFWGMVGRALADGGRVFFIDNLKRPVPGQESVIRFLQRDTSEDGVVVRELNDGREFRAVKIYYEPGDLETRLRGLGWNVDVCATEAFFYYGSGGRG